MEALTKLQDHNKMQISKAFTNFKKSPKDRINESFIETRLESLESLWLSFADVHRQILVDIAESDPLRCNYFKGNIYDDTEEVYISYKTDLKQAMLKCRKKLEDKQSMVKEMKNISSTSTIKLPKINIPTFSGDYTEWTAFKDLYVSLIHNNSSLDDVQKLHYLKGQLTGEAEQLLRHIPITNTNYVSSWKKLCDRYNNKRFLSNHILKRLFGIKPITSESSVNIKELLDTMTECLQALDNLGICTSQWDVIVIYLISQKLDPDTRRQWEARSNEVNDTLPTLDSFKAFLEHRYRSLEFLDVKKVKSAVGYVKSANVHACTDKTSVCCPFCKEEHKLFNCSEFSKQDFDTRHNFVQSNKLCFNCLAPYHSVYVCRQSTRCRICKRKHHSLLHPPNGSQSQTMLVQEVTNSSTEEAQEESDNVTACFSNISSQVLLATALVNAKSKSGQHVVLRCLLDQGSQASFVTESAVQALKLKKIRNKINISGVGNDGNVSIVSKSFVSIELQSIHDPTYIITVKAYVLNKLTNILPSKRVSCNSWSALGEMKLADPRFNNPSKIDLLLSAEIYGQILIDGVRKGPVGRPIAQNTRLGWILSGRVESDSADFGETRNVISMHIQHDDSNELLKKFWELESDQHLLQNKILTPEENRCEVIFRQTTVRDETGRYVVKLPFRDDDPDCVNGNSEEIAKRRLHSLERKLENNKVLKDQYRAALQEYLDLNHMELVPENELKNKGVVYLPHHAVIREDKSTTKVRVVFDASCRGTNGVSLNDNLLVGPSLQPDLRDTVMRWRQHNICLVADIVKMYRQVKVTKSDADYQRILWRDSEGKLQHYRMLRVTFGTASAPFLAVRALQQLAYDHGFGYEESSSVSQSNRISKEIADKILFDFYMDDLMTGSSTVEEGLKIYQELNKVMKQGGFHLQKWVSNSKEIMDNIGSKDKKEGCEINAGKEVEGVRKVLGITWNCESDMIEYSVKLPEERSCMTKRQVISQISRLFDPLGWIAPLIIQAKIFIQKLWLSGIGWDDQLPPNLHQEWSNYRQELTQLTGFRLPRWMHTSPEDKHMELHGFCDASNDAYAAVIYLRTVSSSDEVRVSLITSKTKVAPIKQVSIPRLELCGAVLLARLLFEVSSILRIPKQQIHAWTDSSVVLAWLSSHPSRWNTFIGNRVSDIITLFDRSHWAHVRSKDNPADCASRGVKPSLFPLEEMWNSGPTWLYDMSIKYSPLETDSQVWDTNLEERTKRIQCATIVFSLDETISKFSTLPKLLRVLAYCNRFIQLKCIKTAKDFPAWLTTVELRKALVVCIKSTQNQYFFEDIKQIKKAGWVNRESKLRSFNLFLCEQGLLRVGGRLQQSKLNYNAKHPILIPHESRLAYLIIAEAHQMTLHGGPQLMINYIRTKYWIIKLKSQVKSYVRECVTCIRHASKTLPPIMGQLPAARVTPCRPFEQSGVDYAGPIAIRTTKGRGQHATKGYICLFICMATRALHLEAVSDMTSDGFLAAFKRFVSRRGHCAELWSDNGSNFVGAARELKILLETEKSRVAVDIADWLATNGTNWHRIPPHAPNFGGLWEAGIKSTKHHLKRVIGTSTLTFEELTTVLTQIEACLNSRPISRMSEDADDPSPLTPGHFLIGEPLLLVPDYNFEHSNVSSLKRWQYSQKMVQDFWKRWSQEYLSLFLRRYKWNMQVPEPKIGDVVLVKEDDLPPARWLFGVIVDKHPGLDNVTRVVSLRCKGNIIKRPVSKLCVLPVVK